MGRIDGSIEGRTDGSTEGRIDATVILSCKFNRGKKMKQRIVKVEKKKETSKNSSNLMLRIEMAIKDSRVFCSSALLRD